MNREKSFLFFVDKDSRQKVTNIPGKLTFDSDGLATMHSAEFMDSPRFKRAYELGKATGSWGASDPFWRVYVCCWAAEQVKDLPGDFVECGVHRGGASRAVIEYINFSSLSKTFYLLDTFQGLDARYMSKTELERHDPTIGGRYIDCYQAVQETFADFSVRIIRGTVPDTLEEVAAQAVCYLSIDMNCAIPEIAAAKYFWDKLVPGGIIILDDYAWVANREQREAFDEFAQQYDVPILSLPTGQGLIVKPATGLMRSELPLSLRFGNSL